MSDLRTKAGREDEILNEIRDSGGISIFWATENQKRACAVDRLVRSGKIIRAFPVTKFPFVRYEVTGC